MNEISMKEIRRRGKGLLAFVLMFMLMFGSNLTVLAANNDTLNMHNVGNGSDTPKTYAGGSGCEHYYEWEVLIEPTKDADGLEQEKCISCGAVKEQLVIPKAAFFASDMIRVINAAPANSTVEVKFPMYNCLTDAILKALEDRGNVSLKVTFEDRTEPDNVVIRSFTIPAGQVNKAYNENNLNGLLYYGSVYGWN